MSRPIPVIDATIIERRLSFIEFCEYVKLMRNLYGQNYAKRILDKYLPNYYNIDNEHVLFGNN